jgi:hypothetical protein
VRQPFSAIKRQFVTPVTPLQPQDRSFLCLPEDAPAKTQTGLEIDMAQMTNQSRMPFGFEEQMKNADPGVFQRWYDERLLLKRPDVSPASEAATADQPTSDLMRQAA